MQKLTLLKKKTQCFQAAPSNLGSSHQLILPRHPPPFPVQRVEDLSHSSEHLIIHLYPARLL